MSLKEAVLEIATAMENEAKDLLEREEHGDLADIILRKYSGLIRLMCKAAENETPITPVADGKILDFMKKQATEDAEIAKKRSKTQERYGEKMVWIDDAEVYTNVPAAMPEGAKTVVLGKVYRLQGNNLIPTDEPVLEGRG